MSMRRSLYGCVLLFIVAGGFIRMVSASVVGGQATPGVDAAPGGIRVPGPKICDPGTFANCHPVEGATPPKLVHAKDLEYPGVARRLHIEGESVVQLVVDEQGRPQNVTTLKSATEKLPSNERDAGLRFDANARKAVKEFRFQPANLNGKAVPSQIVIEERFHLY